MNDDEHVRRCGVCGFSYADHLRGAALGSGCCGEFADHLMRLSPKESERLLREGDEFLAATPSETRRPEPATLAALREARADGRLVAEMYRRMTSEERGAFLRAHRAKPETFKQYLCEVCLSTSDIKPDGWHEQNGWTQAMDEEGALDRCPTCRSEHAACDEETSGEAR